MLYVLKNDLSNIRAVYNVEFCGIGDSLAIWPVKENEKEKFAVESAGKAADSLKMKIKTAKVPFSLLSSDHLSFRLKGIKEAVTLSLLPGDQLDMLERFISSLSVSNLLSGRRRSMPGLLANIHKPSDDSSRLSEGSLNLMLSLLIEIIQRC